MRPVVTAKTFAGKAASLLLAPLPPARMAWIALARWKERLVALASALAFGGILASWSWGGGIMIWPVIAIALVARRVRSLGAWAAFGGNHRDRSSRAARAAGVGGQVVLSALALARRGRVPARVAYGAA